MAIHQSYSPGGVYFLCRCSINGFAGLDQVYIPATSLPPHFSLERLTRAQRLALVWSILPRLSCTCTKHSKVFECVSQTTHTHKHTYKHTEVCSHRHIGVNQFAVSEGSEVTKKPSRRSCEVCTHTEPKVDFWGRSNMPV